MNTLIIKNIPKRLTYSEREELFLHFGAQSVTNLPNYSFVLYENEFKSREAMTRMHQLLVFDKRLRVEFAVNQTNNNINRLPNINEPHIKEKTDKESYAAMKRRKLEEFFNQIHYISPSLGLNYLSSPLLKYSYPSATLQTVNNIAHALISNPKFYTQVLHLMNKMNIFPPFEHNIQRDIIINFDKNFNQNINPQTNNSESELEFSDNEEYGQRFGQIVKPVKRKAKVLKVGFVGEKACNKPKTFKSSHEKAVKPSTKDVFEVNNMSEKSNIEISIVSDLKNINENSVCDNKTISKTTGFGFIQKIEQKTDKQFEEVSELDFSDIIDDKELESNRLSGNEFNKFSVFKKYESGVPSVRLYVKNIAKCVETKDLFRIFAKFIDRESETHRNMFDIQYMKSGKMRGQAFITFPTESTARQAIDHTNGYFLKEKPIVVMYARSARPQLSN